MRFYSDTAGTQYVMTKKGIVPFVEGVLDTEDTALINKLKAAGFRHDAPAEKTKAEIMSELDERGVKYDRRWQKEKLSELIGGA